MRRSLISPSQAGSGKISAFPAQRCRSNVHLCFADGRSDFRGRRPECVRHPRRVTTSRQSLQPPLFGGAIVPAGESSRPLIRSDRIASRRQASLASASVAARRFILAQRLPFAGGLLVVQPRCDGTAVRAPTRFDGIEICDEATAVGEHVPLAVDEAHSVGR